MKVYVVEVDTFDDNPTIQAIYSTIEKAKEHFDDLVDYYGEQAEPDQYDFISSNQDCYITIGEYDVK